MRYHLMNIFRLGIKELRSLKADPVLLVLIVYTFTFAIYAVATGARFEVDHAAVAIVDEDRSGLSRRIQDALLEPLFKRPVEIASSEIDPAMNAGQYVFVIEIPPRFEQDLISGRTPSIQINVDATAMTQAGNGAVYLNSIILQEVATYLQQRQLEASLPINVVLHAKFNPNLKSEWFTSVMQVINNITILSIILSGAALIREREHGTIEHLLVMPVTPLEIMLSKILANGLVIVTAASLSLLVIVERLLGVPIAGSIPLFIAGAIIYQFSVAALGILLATYTNSMAQFGLLAIPVLVVMNLLSGSTTPMESMPVWLQNVMQLTPSPHFVSFAQAVLYRGAGVPIVWPDMAALVIIGVAYFAVAALRFRRVMTSFH
ncbi:ABC transporter permease [Microvirga flavescens]|uniref:ABC transporter permease n=1 Tax=Microvirga flavescens TaxID=2249811 RepID=UPI000DD811BF|nr:ABC transporter permease [Microvirga flavescens]